MLDIPFQVWFESERTLRQQLNLSVIPACHETIIRMMEIAYLRGRAAGIEFGDVAKLADARVSRTRSP